MAKKCSKCNAENPDTSSYCADCGTQLKSPGDSPVLTQTLETPYPQFSPGTPLLGRYEILKLLGKGGMGEVYLAEDKNLKRQVAIKILPSEFSLDKDRLARFEREARLLAALNHPNIATVYGHEKSENQQFLVMELVEGDTFADRIKKGPLPLDEALGVCKQIAEGLESAHEKGIIHRDLKPANVKVTSEGKVKILDFGLAKAFYDEATVTAADLSKSPTLTDRMTRPGTILGTAAYMSPEQARSRPVDKRTDIWAFGCVLYECLTGKPAFLGETVSDTLALILRGEPDWTKLPAETPNNIRTLLRRCLHKDKKNRLHDIADARIEIDETGSFSAEEPESSLRFPILRLAAICALLFMAGFLIRALFWKGQKSASLRDPVVSVIKLEPGHSLEGERSGLEFNWPRRTAMALSRDGRFIVYCAVDDAGGEEKVPRLFMRRLGEIEASPIPGTEGGIAPFLSPDDRWIGFWADGKLKKIPTEGGLAQDICASGNLGACWGIDDRIVFSDNATSGLYIVSASGGTPENITTPDVSKGESEHKLPFYLPDAQSVLFTVWTNSPEKNLKVALFDSQTRVWKYLIDDASDARYVPSGHIVFMRQGMLMAIPFSLGEQKVSGQAVRVRPGVIHDLKPSGLGTSAGQYNVSPSGSLIFAPGGMIPEWNNSWAWVDKDGNDVPASSRLENFFRPNISPDGKKFVYQMLGEDRDIWVCDIARDISFPITTDDVCWTPLWTPDWNKIIYGKRPSDRSFGIFSREVEGGDETEELIVSVPHENHALSSVSPDGTRLALVVVNKDHDDINIYDFRSKEITPFKATKYNECDPQFSPDGRWLLYSSDKEGRFEVYVSSSSGSGGEIKVTSQGGREPGWARSGKQIFYRANKENEMWEVDFHPEMELPTGKPRLLFQSASFGAAAHTRCWDISPDDQRFLMVKRERFPLKPVTELILVQNWIEDLKRLVSSGQ